MNAATQTTYAAALAELSRGQVLATSSANDLVQRISETRASICVLRSAQRALRAVARTHTDALVRETAAAQAGLATSHLRNAVYRLHRRAPSAAFSRVHA